MEKTERIVAENPQELIGLRFRRLLSPAICKKIIQRRNGEISDSAANEKAEGVASAVGAALGYWEAKSTNLNSWIVSRYYALLHLTIAEQVAAGDESRDLASVQRHTEYGHGIATWRNESGEYPSNYLIYLLRSGYFCSYLKFRGYQDIPSFSLEKRLKAEPNQDQQGFCVSLGELLRRIPELEDFVEEYLNEPPLSIGITHSSHNMHLESEARQKYFDEKGGFGFSIPEEDQPRTKRTYIDLIPSSEAVSLDFVRSLKLPIEEISVGKDEVDKAKLYRGFIDHPREDYWWQHVKTYKSNYCGTTLVCPVFGKIGDPILIHFMTLYGLAITARYLPDLWRKITIGELNHVAALIEHYLSLVDNVIPLKMLERITGVRTIVVQPGSLNAPV